MTSLVWGEQAVEGWCTYAVCHGVVLSEDIVVEEEAEEYVGESVLLIWKKIVRKRR